MKDIAMFCLAYIDEHSFFLNRVPFLQHKPCDIGEWLQYFGLGQAFIELNMKA